MNINKVTQVGLLLILLISKPIKAGKDGEASSSAAASIDDGEGISSAAPVKMITLQIMNLSNYKTLCIQIQNVLDNKINTNDINQQSLEI